MTQTVTSAQMRAIEAEAIGAGRVSGTELMERAGAAVAEAIAELFPGPPVPGRRAVVLCGPGNNGGDGFVVARLLRRRGWKVALYLFGDPDRLPADAAVAAARWRRIGRVQHLPAQPDFDTPDLVVDALFGIGLSRPLTGFEAIFRAIALCRVPVVAIDLPSGRDADARPEAEGWPAAPCTLAVTFHAEKPIHRQLRAQGVSVVVAPIGL